MSEQMTAAEAKATVRAIRDQLDAFAGQLDRIDHSAARDVHRARDTLFAAWRTLHRIASDFQEGEKLDHYKGSGAPSNHRPVGFVGSSPVKFVGPIKHDTRYAQVQDVYGNRPWVDFADLDRPGQRGRAIDG